jgi:uncharacterized repeat protein (TIGR01451 family)
VTSALLDILVNKVDSVDPVALGETTTYTVTITNAGPSFGTNVVMVDNFPSGSPTATFSYQGNLTLTPPGIGACTEPATDATSGTLTCTLPGLASGQSAVLTYDMRAEAIAAGVSGTTFNTATVSVTEPETQLTNNAATNATTSRRTADLAIVKSAPATATPGTNFDYTLTVTNNGPNPSTGAIVSDALPAGLTFVSASSGCAFASGTITCTLGTLASGASAPLTVSVHASSPFSGAAPIVNGASVTAVNEVDPDTSNNAGTASTALASAQTDLSLVKTGPASVPALGLVTYTLAIANAGPSAADGATFSDTLPAGLTSVAATCGAASGGASCGAVAAGGGTVSGTIATLPSGGSIVVTVTANVPVSGTLVNSAIVAPPAGATDPDPANNSGSATTIVTQSDLALSKTHAGTLTQGQVGAVYTLMVTNAGAAPTVGPVTVTDTLPVGLTASAISGAGWTCSLAPLSCTRGDTLAAGAAYPPVFVTVNVDADAPASLVNVAVVSGGGDGNAANDAASDPASVAPATAVVAAPVPASSPLALAAMALLLLATAVVAMRRP